MPDDCGTKKQILFVDDEQKILDGLRRMLHRFRDEWDMDFALSGKEALEKLGQAHFDVIVSDMRMPEMDGAALLNLVKEKYPNIVRFILSGYSDRGMILRTVGATDQFLTKPCDPNSLKESIMNALNAQKLLDKKEMRSMVSGMKSLPTLPDLYVKLKAALDSPNTSFKDITQLVEQDMTVSAKVLQLVNSAFFGLKHHIDSLQHAITYLGTETLKAVVLTTDVFSQFSEEEIETFQIRNLYYHSMCVGAVARKITETISKDRKFVDEVSMAGMLHDIGKIILVHNIPVEYKAALNKQTDKKEPFFELERQHIGITHADIGGYLMTLWGLPESIVKAITFHHTPKRTPHTVFTSTTAVYIANILVCGSAGEDKQEYITLDYDYIEKLKITLSIDDWKPMAAELVEKLKATSNLF